MRGRPSLRTVTDNELLRRLSEIVKQCRCAEADVVAHIAEVDARRLYAREAAHSMFAYCTEILHFSEQEAYLRITVARASREHPMLLEMLRDGRLHLSGIARLVPHLTLANREELLRRAVHKSKRQIEELVAALAPRPESPAVIRRLPERKAEGLTATTSLDPDRAGSPRPGLGQGQVGSRPEGLSSGELAGPYPLLWPDRLTPSTGELGPDRVPAAPQIGRAVVEPVGPARFRVRFDASAELRDKLERLQALMRSSVPDGDLAKIIDAAVTEKLERLEAKRFAKTRKPRRGLDETDTTPKSRHIPAAVRRAVYERDRGRCTYRDGHGRRCGKRHDLEFHHDGTPFGRHGDHSLKNIRLMCKTHNALRAEEEYGKEVMARLRRMAKQVSERTPGWSQPRNGRPGHASRGADLLVGPPQSGPG